MSFFHIDLIKENILSPDYMKFGNFIQFNLKIVNLFILIKNRFILILEKEIDRQDLLFDKEAVT
jgi:hypothetical protein